MKIVLITNLYEPYGRGGAEIVVKRTAEEMARLGHEVVVITAKPFKGKGSSSGEESLGSDASSALKIRRFYPFNLFFYGNDYKWPFFIRILWHLIDMYNLQSAGKVRQILKEEKPDVVMTHNLIGLGFLIPRVIKKLNIFHIHILHDVQLAVRSGVLKHGKEPRAGLYRAVVKKLFASPNVIVSPSEFLISFYKKFGYFKESEFKVIRNPVDDRFAMGEGAGRAGRHAGQESERAGGDGGGREAEHQPNEQVNFAYIGQLEKQKGVMLLKKVFEKLSTDFPDKARLHFAGAGSQAKELEASAANHPNILFHGKIPNQELPQFLKKVDVIVLPTLIYENSPTIIYEALALGIPVIVSNIGGAAELPQNSFNGLEIEPGSFKSLYDALVIITDDIESYSANAKKSAYKISQFSTTNYVKQLLALL